MKLFLIGATGRTGNWILKSALARGHHVTALVRGGESRLAIRNPFLKVVDGDLLHMNLEAAVAGHDAILSALDSSTVAAGTEKVIAATAKSGVKRFIGIAGGGILQLDETRLRRDRPGYPSAFVKYSEQHLQSWKMLEASTLDWTLICTPDILDEPASGRAQFKADYMPEGGRSIPAGDMAEFIMNELDHPQFRRKRVGMTV